MLRGRVFALLVGTLAVSRAQDIISGTLALSLPFAALNSADMVAAIRDSIAAATDGIQSSSVIIDAVCGADGALAGCAPPPAPSPTRRSLLRRRRLSTAAFAGGSSVKVNVIVPPSSYFTQAEWSGLLLGRIQQATPRTFKSRFEYNMKKVHGIAIEADWLAGGAANPLLQSGPVLPTPAPTPVTPTPAPGATPAPTPFPTSAPSTSSNTGPGSGGTNPYARKPSSSGVDGGMAALLAILALMVFGGVGLSAKNFRARRKMGAPRAPVRRISKDHLETATDHNGAQADGDTRRADRDGGGFFGGLMARVQGKIRAMSSDGIGMMDNPMQRGAAGSSRDRDDVAPLAPEAVRRAASAFEPGGALDGSSLGGELQKRNEMGLWQPRYFAQHPTAGPRFLCYWANRDMSKLLGVIDLASLGEMRISHKTTCPPGFEVLKLNTGERTWTFAAPLGGGAGAGTGASLAVSQEAGPPDPAVAPIIGALAWAGRLERLQQMSSDGSAWKRPKLAADVSNVVGGWLYKRNQASTWQRRFVPPRSNSAPGAIASRPGDTGSLFCYFTDHTQANIRGAVELKELASIRASDKTASPPGTEVFKMVTGEGTSGARTWVFAVLKKDASGIGGAKAWIRRICLAAGRQDILDRPAM